ncbi:hypothetical protein R1sor_026207 [Riccia sorocarpa]|uniref:Uncharacterized protein n=1 Tax=Riccia sorocarpa TaxID=122646 RepID=A0ABD3GCT2_9MARC
MNDRNQQYPVLHSNQGYNSTRASVDLGANPFHVLAGAFEVEMEETSNQLEVTTGPTKNGELETPRNDKHLEEESETDVEEEIDAVSTHYKEKLANNVKSHEETLEFLMREAQKLQAEAQSMLGESSTSPAEDSETGTQESEETQGVNLETLAPILQLEPTPPIKLVKADWSEEPEDDDEVSLEPCDQNEQSWVHERDSDLSLDVLKGEKTEDTSHTNVAEFEGEREEGNGQLARYSASLAEWQDRPSTYDNIVFNASKQPSQLAIGDSQTKSGTWRRIDIGRRTQILADTEVEGEGKAGSEVGDDFSEEGNTQLSSPSTSGARGKPPDNQGIEGVSKGQIRPAEFTDSTPDRGNQTKKRVVNDPKTYHKQLLFSQEIGPSWLVRNLETDVPLEQVEHLPDQALEREESDAQSPPELLPELVKDATGQDGMEVERLSS